MDLKLGANYKLINYFDSHRILEDIEGVIRPLYQIDKMAGRDKWWLKRLAGQRHTTILKGSLAEIQTYLHKLP
jgi:hypothetical protein